MKNTILKDFRNELKYAIKLRDDGVETVPAVVAGAELANGRLFVPIDEYVARWENGIVAMENGADPAMFEY